MYRTEKVGDKIVVLIGNGSYLSIIKIKENDFVLSASSKDGNNASIRLDSESLDSLVSSIQSVRS